MPSELIERPTDLTDNWLTTALGAGTVTGHHFERIGTGQMSECYRVHLRYADGDTGPATVVLKVAADTPRDILVKAEYAAFLAQTHLDRLRPDQEILFSELGKYKILLEHIAVHRYFLGIEQRREVPYEEAVASWYDRVYRPLVDTFRRTGALAHFPGRTEADLYVWVSEHLHYLREMHGPDVDLEQAVRDYTHRFGIPGDPPPSSGL
ncbi:MAG TPA: hypothetical protein PKM13_01935 [Candidatus Bipolaricaulis anaerobius]|nr:hypothetical protein [Candidatus Bipolaricaulis anaerobius]